jgi:hypothetical protein
MAGLRHSLALALARQESCPLGTYSTGMIGSSTTTQMTGEVGEKAQQDLWMCLLLNAPPDQIAS